MLEEEKHVIVLYSRFRLFCFDSGISALLMMLVASLANACACESCVSELIVRLRNALFCGDFVDVIPVAERLGLLVSRSLFVVLRTALLDIRGRASDLDASSRHPP